MINDKKDNLDVIVSVIYNENKVISNVNVAIMMDDLINMIDINVNVNILDK